MHKPSTPIFIIGTERSGSNLLRLILNAHSGIAVPHPPHILHFFTPLAASYGDLRQPQARRELVRDVLGLLRVHIYPWEMAIAPERIMAAGTPAGPDDARPQALMGVFFALYDEYLRQSGKRRWGCKSTFVIEHVGEVLAACPSAKFILLVRDPRDVAVSSRRSIFNPFHPYFTAQLWRRQQLLGAHWLDSAEREKFHLLRYEDLIERPPETVAALCQFLGEEYQPQMLNYHTTPAARKSQDLSASWRNVGTPIKPLNRNTFRTGLSAAETKLVEAVCADLMPRFGYPLAFPPTELAGPARPPAPARILWFWLLDWRWRLAVEWQAFRHDRNYPLHWRRRFFLWQLRLRRRWLAPRDSVIPLFNQK